jgi:hypothetical protein
MSASPPPRYAVHPVHSPPARKRGRWLWWALAWLVSLALAVGLTIYISSRPASPGMHGDTSDPKQLAAENANLKQQLAIAKQTQQVTAVATKKLTDNLATRDEKISNLRADLAFYSHLVGGGARNEGLKLQKTHLQPVPNSRAWNITLTLTRNAKRDTMGSGVARVDVDGVSGGQLKRLRWKDITGPDQKNGLDFKFRFFQQLQGTIMLPKGFTPNRLRITIDPKRGKSMTQTLPWTSALKNPEK